MRSPVFTNSGTCTTAPVSSVAGLVTFETVSPLTPGSVSDTPSSTEAGSCTPVGLPLTSIICTGFDVLELDDSPERAVELDVHSVLELIGVDGLGHSGATG